MKYLRTYGIKGHVLANKSGGTMTHRLVLFNLIGYGPHRCACGQHINWRHQGNHALVVDHIDGDGLNNELSNLRALCPYCNNTRWNTAKTHCSRGHEFDQVLRGRGGGSYRGCSTCMRAHGAKQSAQRKAARHAA